MKKKLLSLVISFIVILLSSSVCFAAGEEAELNSSFSGLKDIIPSSQIDLYNSSDCYCASYFKLQNGGYVIFEPLTKTILEYSIESDPTNYKINGKKQIYLGPTNYYEKNNDIFKDKNKIRNENLNKQSAQEIDIFKNSCSGTFVDGSSYSEVIGQVGIDSSGYLLHNTVLVNNNTNGTCGSTAATIVFLYYEDYIDTKYITSTERTNYNSLTNTLISYIEPNYGGTTYSQLKSGINKFLSSRNLSSNCDYITKSNILTSPLSKITSYIDKNKPCIIGLKSNTPTYGAHWAVATGYVTYTWTQPQSTTPYAQFIQVNDGWGNRNIWINYKYIDGMVYLK